MLPLLDNYVNFNKILAYEDKKKINSINNTLLILGKLRQLEVFQKTIISNTKLYFRTKS